MNKEQTICWVLQQNLTPPKILEQIKTTLLAQGVDYQEVTVIPFSTELPKGIDSRKFNIFYGSTTLMLNVYESEQLRKGLFYEPLFFSMQNYLQQWGRRMFNDQGLFFELQELVKQELTLESQWFIRPNGDTKAFSGTVMSFQEIGEWYNKIAHLPGSTIEPTTEVMIAVPRMPEKEWRCFIVDGQVVASCRYAVKGELAVNAKDVPVEMLAFVQACIALYVPHPIFVLDVAWYQNKYYLLECGCMNSTGFYNASVAAVVTAVNEYFLP